ncbi:MAG: type II secretion system protein [Erysipelotrichaceae bacterium]
MNNKKGFTLIELIVVIAILGVLALILVPNFMGYLADAKKTTASTNATNAYKMAAAKAATGNATTKGHFTAAEILPEIQSDYPTAKIFCEGSTTAATGSAKCSKVTGVEVTSSGWVALYENGKDVKLTEAK